ncbi:MAG: DNA polymerase III subunit gamma/tau, partial [Burkholderiaceae bacterium]|nr:DNA polymerase III subunit gamma/tau [Burkholderiaceae bacterium]
MTYLVLARKYRPRSFDTLIGQDHVVRALTHALDSQRLHHAWLFTGTRGVGKTTLSRILAKSLNCHTGITSKPCGVCQACTEIDSGRYIDYVELDAASNRGVDEMTQLLEQAVYAPGAGRFKVYMIDEVHMLTGHAFNAMLKTLEEPPSHVKFILATTDPQKIPVTVLSRCLQFNLKQMPPDAIVDHLTQVLGEENIPGETPALRLLAQAAGGSMRDALSLTDQAIAYSAGQVTEDAVRGMLGTIDQRHLVRLLRALSAGSAGAVLEVADELATRGLSYSGALADVSTLLSRVAVAQRVPGALDSTDPLAADIVALAGELHPDVLQLFYSIAVHSRAELALAPDEYAGFVMACLRMLSLVAQAGPVEPIVLPAIKVPGTDAEAAATATVPSAAGLASVGASTAPSQVSAVLQPAQSPNRVASSAPRSSLAHIPPVLQESAPQQPVQARSTAGVRSTEPPPWDTGSSSTRSLDSNDTPVAAAIDAVPVDAVSTVSSSATAILPPQPRSESSRESLFAAVVTEAVVPEPMASAEVSLAVPVLPHAPASLPAARSQSEPTDDVPSWLNEAIPDDAQGADAGRYMATGDDDDEFETLLGDAADAVMPVSVAGPVIATPPPASRAVRKRTPRVTEMTAEAWPELAAALPVTGLAAELARQSEWQSADHGTVRLRVAVRTLADSA